jgi:hypothetical protein
MSNLIKNQGLFLRLLLETKSKIQRKALLDTIDKQQLQALVEIAHNLLQGVIHVTAHNKKKLVAHKKFIRLLGDPKIGLTVKKEALCHKGPAVVLLLRSVWPTLKTFLSS